MDKKINVLIYPSGGENALEVKEALSKKVNITVFGASSKKDHSLFVYKNFFFAPNVNENDFLVRFNKLLVEHKIDLIIPTHDTVALKLSEQRDQLNAILISSDFETNKICRHKIMLYKQFSQYDFGLKYFLDPNKVNRFPCFLKPDEGEGGKLCFVANDKIELNYYLSKLRDKKMIITEYLPGDEFTVDCFTNKNGELLFVGPRKRERIFGGVSANSFTVESLQFNQIAETINQNLRLRGYWFFQVKEDFEGNLKLMEVSTRPAGTMALYRQRGINFMLLSIYDFMEYDYEILDNGFFVELDRSLTPKYKTDVSFDSIYIDFDDTLVFENKINYYCLILLYQAKEKNIPVILLTKHQSNINQTLRKHCLSENLFEKIIVLDKDLSKVDFIEHKKPIFIDNSFFERKHVREKLNIPVFDTDSVVSLLDWRE